MKRMLAMVAVLAITATGSSRAALVYGTSAVGELVGSRTQENLVEGGNYVGDTLSVGWNIVDAGGGFWTYTYTFTGFASPAISHFILDLTDEVLDDPALVTALTANPGTIDLDSSRGTFTGSEPSNPGLAGPITGIKINTEGAPDGPFSVSFRSNQAPVYGDIYFKGGSSSFAYNVGLTQHGTSELIADFVARPNGTPAVPEPSSVALIGMGLAGLAGAGLRRHRMRS